MVAEEPTLISFLCMRSEVIQNETEKRIQRNTKNYVQELGPRLSSKLTVQIISVR